MEGFYPEVDLGQGQVDALKPMQDWQNVLLTQQNKYHTMADTQRIMAETKNVLAQARKTGAETGLVGAQTGMVGAQTVGQQINNARSGMFLGAQKNALGGMQSGPQGQQPETMPTPWGGGAPSNASSYGGETGRDLVTPSGNAQPGSLAPTYGHPGSVQLQYAPDSGPQSSNVPAAMPGANLLAAASLKGGAPGPSANSLAAASAVQHAVPAAQPIDQNGNALASTGQPMQVAQSAPPPGAAHPFQPSGEPPTGVPTHPSLMPPIVQKNPNYMPPGGSINPYVGLPVPDQWSAMATLGANDLAGWYKNLEGLAGRRATVMLQTIAGATDKPSWNAAVQNLYEQHFLTVGQAWQYYGHPELKQQVINSLAPAASQVGYAGTALGQGFEIGPDGHPVPNAPMLNAKGPIAGKVLGTDGQYHDVAIPRAQYVQSTTETASPAAAASRPPTAPKPAGASAGTPAGASAAGNVGAAPDGSYQRYATLTAQRESHGEATAQNPNSSAGGLYQFTDGTWATYFPKAYPQMAGISQQQMLAMKYNPEAQNRVFEAETAGNAALLLRAGVPVNQTTLALAHGLGPNLIPKMMDIPADTPLRSLVNPHTMQINGWAPNMTMGQLVDGVKSQYGLGPVTLPSAAPEAAAPTARQLIFADGASGAPPAAGLPGAAPAGAAAETMPAVPAAPPVSGLPSGTMVGPPQLTPAQKNQTAADQDQIKSDSASVEKITEAARAAQQSTPTLLEARDLVSSASPGAFGDWRTKIAAFFKTFGGDWSNEFLKRTAGIDPSKAPQMEQLQKLLFQVAGGAAQSIGAHNIGAEMTKMYSEALPNINKQPETIRNLTNDMLVLNQYRQDYATAAADHYTQSRGAFVSNPVGNRYQPLSGFDKQWLDSKGGSAPTVYAAAAAAMNGNKNADWTRGLSPQQIAAALSVVRRVDPSATIAGPNGPLRLAGAH